MNKLESELQRLYFLPGQVWPNSKSDTDKPLINLITATGLVRCLVISVEQGCDWGQLATLYQGIQEDLDLPAPAISISFEDGYQIWFSLAEPVGLQSARDFMAGLCQKYLTETKVTKLKLRPGIEDKLGFLSLPPAKHAESERWSAFIDPTMGSMFVEETWLEMPPNPNQQASMLSGLKSISAEAFERGLHILQSPPAAASSSTAQTDQSVQLQSCATPTTFNIGGDFSNPYSFLLTVMNDPSASAEQRMQAAIALLPFFDKD